MESARKIFNSFYYDATTFILASLQLISIVKWKKLYDNIEYQTYAFHSNPMSMILTGYCYDSFRLR